MLNFFSINTYISKFFKDGMGEGKGAPLKQWPDQKQHCDPKVGSQATTWETLIDLKTEYD